MDALDLNQVGDLLSYWKKNRPLHLLVQDLLGTEEAAPQEPEQPPSPAELQNIASMFGG